MPPGITENDINEYRGFIYVIRHKATGRQYIGRKTLWSKRGKKIVESDWRRYWGSSGPLRAAVRAEGPEAFEREIIRFCRSDREMTYAETRELWRRDVLSATLDDGTPAYWNQNIGGRWFQKDWTAWG